MLGFACFVAVSGGAGYAAPDRMLLQRGAMPTGRQHPVPRDDISGCRSEMAGEPSAREQWQTTSATQWQTTSTAMMLRLRGGGPRGDVPQADTSGSEKQGYAEINQWVKRQMKELEERKKQVHDHSCTLVFQA